MLKNSSIRSSLRHLFLASLIFAPQIGTAETVDFVSTRPDAVTGLPVEKRLSLPGASRLKNAVVLHGNDPRIIQATRSRTCKDIYGEPGPNLSYSGGPVFEYTHDSPDSEEPRWHHDSGACTRHYTEERVLACSPEKRGSIIEKRSYDLADDDSASNDTGWIQQENTCELFFVEMRTETKKVSCSNPEDIGYDILARNYELWSDGSRRNYTSWTSTPVGDDENEEDRCEEPETKRDVVEKETLECPANMKGEIVMQRQYEIWSSDDAEDRADAREEAEWVEIQNTCEYYLVATLTETENVSCPEGYSGQKVRARFYELWSDGSKRNYSNWSTTQDNCTKNEPKFKPVSMKIRPFDNVSIGGETPKNWTGGPVKGSAIFFVDFPFGIHMEKNGGQTLMSQLHMPPDEWYKLSQDGENWFEIRARWSVFQTEYNYPHLGQKSYTVEIRTETSYVQKVDCYNKDSNYLGRSGDCYRDAIRKYPYASGMKSSSFDLDWPRYKLSDKNIPNVLNDVTIYFE